MRLSVLLISIFLPLSATAAEFFVLPGTKTLLMMGVTMPSDVETLENYINKKEIDGIILKGPGGNLNAGYAIAELMLKHNLDVQVPENTECASACSLIYAAGATRRMEPGSKLGFHLPFMLLDTKDVDEYCKALAVKTAVTTPYVNIFGGANRDCLERTYQMGLRDIRKLERYLKRDGISENLLDIVIDTPTGEMTWLNPEQAAQLGLVNR